MFKRLMKAATVGATVATTISIVVVFGVLGVTLFGDHEVLLIVLAGATAAAVITAGSFLIYLIKAGKREEAKINDRISKEKAFEILTSPEYDRERGVLNRLFTGDAAHPLPPEGMGYKQWAAKSVANKTAKIESNAAASQDVPDGPLGEKLAIEASSNLRQGLDEIYDDLNGKEKKLAQVQKVPESAIDSEEEERILRETEESMGILPTEEFVQSTTVPVESLREATKSLEYMSREYFPALGTAADDFKQIRLKLYRAGLGRKEVKKQLEGLDPSRCIGNRRSNEARVHEAVTVN